MVVSEDDMNKGVAIKEISEKGSFFFCIVTGRLPLGWITSVYHVKVPTGHQTQWFTSVSLIQMQHVTELRSCIRWYWEINIIFRKEAKKTESCNKLCAVVWASDLKKCDLNTRLPVIVTQQKQCFHELCHPAASWSRGLRRNYFSLWRDSSAPPRLSLSLHPALIWRLYDCVLNLIALSQQGWKGSHQHGVRPFFFTQSLSLNLTLMISKAAFVMTKKRKVKYLLLDRGRHWKIKL